MHLFEKLNLKIQELLKGRNTPLRIAINGIEGSGKTTMAGNLVNYLKNKGLSAFHISIDGYHFHKEHRYKQGRDSAQGYYEDSYNEKAFVQNVLELSQTESSIVPKIHNLETDEYLKIEKIIIPSDSILITDGAYLFKPNYIEYWDLKIYLKTDFEISLARGAERDKYSLGSFEQAIDKFQKRYHEASRIYLKEVTPEEKADIIINNNDFNKPIIISSK